MGLRNPQPVNQEQALAERLAALEQKISNIEGRSGAWQELPFSGGWTNWSAGNSLVEYMKDPFGVVYVHGLAKNGLAYVYATESAQIGTLPPEYAPALNQPFIALAYDASKGAQALYCAVLSTGVIVVNAGIAGGTNEGTANSWLSLANISFPAAR